MKSIMVPPFLALALFMVCFPTNLMSVEFADLLVKPQLSRIEAAQLARAANQARIQQLDKTAAMAVLSGAGSSTAKLAVAWVKGLDRDIPPKDRLPFMGAIFNSRVTLDPFSAKMCFGWAVRLYPRDYAMITLYDDMRQAGWKIERTEFDRLLASQAQFAGR